MLRDALACSVKPPMTNSWRAPHFVLSQSSPRPGRRGDAGFRESREPLRPVLPGAGEEAQPAVRDAAQHPIAIELDFVQPIRAFGRAIDERRQLRSDEL